jgi:nitrogen regulatory protein P-II 1
MKYIIAVIQPDRLNDVMDALDKNQIHLFTVTEVVGSGRQKGEAEVYRGHKEVGRLLRKVKIEMAVTEDFATKAVEAISAGAKTGQIGDGKVFVLDLEDCVRIRTGENGMEAIG